MNNFLLIPMDFETCDFKQMQEELNNNKNIKWQVHGTPKGKTKYKLPKKAVSLKKGDVVYFYVINLPSGSKRV